MVGDDGPSVSRISASYSENETLEIHKEKQSLEVESVSRLGSAISWLAAHLDDCPRPIIPYIKQTYNLNNLQATEAIRLATIQRGNAADG